MPAALPQDASELPTDAPGFCALYRKASWDIDKKEQAVQAALVSCPEAVAPLRGLISRDLQTLIPAHDRQYAQAASNLIRKRLRTINGREVVAIQQQVHALRADPALTKEQIQQVGDPAIAKLEATLLPTLEEVLASSESLATKRDALMRLGALWEKTAPTPTDISFEDRIVSREQEVTIQGLPMPPMALKVLRDNANVARSLQHDEATCIATLNRYRVLLGLMPCAIDLRLCVAARDHSADMERLDFFSHTSTIPGKESFGDRAKLKGTTANAENIYKSSAADGPAANHAWFVSPGHHRNMLGEYSRVGVGKSGAYYTQMLGR